MPQERYIVHVDMDAFFAAIEQRDNPALASKPVVIGADPKAGRGRGVVSTCSYEARKFGIHSAMPISIAYQKCPHAVFLLPDMEKYATTSAELYEIFYNFTPRIEPVSIDEAFLDITASYHLFGSPLATCKLIKSGIKSRMGLTPSVGLAPTKMAAKIASDINKPDGLVEVTKQSLLDFLWPLDVGYISGLGKKTKAVLLAMGIKTIGQLAKKDSKYMEATLGKNGLYLRQLAQGIDDREVEAESEAKSISNEITFDRDTSDNQQITASLLFLCEKVSRRLRRAQLKGKTVTLKIRLQSFHTYTRAVTIHKATNFVDTIYGEIKRLYGNFNTRGKKVRLVGIKVSNLMTADFKDSLLEDKNDDKYEKMHKAVEQIREKFGQDSIYRAGSKL